MKRFLFLLLSAGLLIGCSDNNPADSPSADDTMSVTTIRKAPIAINAMAYTSPSELYSIYAADPQHVIHFNVARYLAETELIAGANYCLSPTVNPYDSWHLTALPKVVYNYDNTPKYYEFGYVCNGQIVATITTYAQKEIAGVIAYIFSDPLPYTCQDLDYYVGNYPNRYYGTGGTCYLKNCDEPLDFDLPEQGSTDEDERELMLQQMPEEDQEGIQEDMDEQGENLDESIAERDEYWQTIDEYVENNMSEMLNDEEPSGENADLSLQNFIDGAIEGETESDYVNQLVNVQDYQVGYFQTGVLDEYDDCQLQVTRWRGFCGPAACAWVYRGKYNQYNSTYLPIHGDGSNYPAYFVNYTTFAYYDYQSVIHDRSLNCHTALYNYTTRSNDVDNGLSVCWYTETVPFVWGNQWQFPLYYGGMKRGFLRATNGEYTVKFTCKPYEYMWNNHEPLIIEINCDHYIVAFGSGVTLKNNGDVKDKYFLVTDNGYTTSQTNYRPYMRKKNFWNLHYGLKD